MRNATKIQKADRSSERTLFIKHEMQLRIKSMLRIRWLHVVEDKNDMIKGLILCMRLLLNVATKCQQ